MPCPTNRAPDTTLDRITDPRAIRDLFAGDEWAIKARGSFGGLGYRYLPVTDGHKYRTPQ